MSFDCRFFSSFFLGLVVSDSSSVASQSRPSVPSSVREDSCYQVAQGSDRGTANSSLSDFSPSSLFRRPSSQPRASSVCNANIPNSRRQVNSLSSNSGGALLPAQGEGKLPPSGQSENHHSGRTSPALSVVSRFSRRTTASSLSPSQLETRVKNIDKLLCAVSSPFFVLLLLANACIYW